MKIWIRKVGGMASEYSWTTLRTEKPGWVESSMTETEYTHFLSTLDYSKQALLREMFWEAHRG